MIEYREVTFSENFIPNCCKEGRADCPHSPKKQRPVKKNIAL